MSRNLYSILGIEETCSQEDIKKAYRKLALKYHPDKSGDSENFKEIANAYEILGDPSKRQQYDFELKNGPISVNGGFEDMLNNILQGFGFGIKPQNEKPKSP